MRRRIFYFLSGIFLFQLASGQSYIDLLSLNYKLSPNNSYEGSTSKTDIENITSSIVLPIPRKNGDAVIFGTTSNQLSFYGDGIPQSVNRYYYTNFQAGYSKKWNDTLSTLFMLIPRASSDFEELTSEDFQLGGVILFNNKRSEKFKWKYGAYLNQEYFGTFIAPLIGFDWQVGRKTRLFGALPASMRGEFTVNDRLRTGLDFSSSAVSYRLSEKRNSQYIHHSINQMSYFLEKYLTKNIVLVGQVGFSAFRRYRIFNETDRYDLVIWGIGIGGEREEVEVPPFRELSDGLLFQFGIKYRYDLESKK